MNLFMWLLGQVVTMVFVLLLVFGTLGFLASIPGRVSDYRADRKREREKKNAPTASELEAERERNMRAYSENFRASLVTAAARKRLEHYSPTRATLRQELN